MVFVDRTSKLSLFLAKLDGKQDNILILKELFESRLYVGID